MRFTLRSLLIAFSYFGLSATALGSYIQFEHFAAVSRAEGKLVCATCAGQTPLTFVLLGAAGIVALFGRNRLAAVVAVPGIFLLVVSLYA